MRSPSGSIHTSVVVILGEGIGILCVSQIDEVCKTERVLVIDDRLTRLTFLCLDQYHTERSTRTVDRSGGGILED